MANKLHDLRTRQKIPAKDMVAVVRELYPKYDKTIQSKCENGDTYGVSLRPDAMDALLRKFAPNQIEPQARSRHGKHRLTCRITCRMENELYGLLQQQAKADGYATMQDCITALVKNYVEKAKTPKGGTTP